MSTRDPNLTATVHTGGDEEAPELVQRLLTAREVATALRISPMTVYRMVNAGALRALRVGRQVRIPASEVGAYIAQHTTPVGEVGA